MIPRTALLAACCAVLPLASAAVPTADKATSPAARDMASTAEAVERAVMHRLRSVETTLENSVVVRMVRESVPEALHHVRDELSHLAKGKGGGGGGGGDDGGAAGVRPTAAGFALVLAVAGVMMAMS